MASSPLTSFVGRDTEVSQVLKNLGSTRLVTLTGPGGVGKTRLAAEVSGRLVGGAWFVELAPVTEPAEVAYTVLDTLGTRERVISRRTGDPGAGPLDRLAEALADRDDVVILDNCEHVIKAAAKLAGRVLAACPRVRIVANSRQPLRIDGETLYPIPPLSVPPPSAQAWAEESEAHASVRLLRDRAVAVRPDFELHPDNMTAVARICRALDGMPLAIELAAVWLRALTPGSARRAAGRPVRPADRGQPGRRCPGTGVERPALAAVFDAIAVFVLRSAGSAGPSESAAPAATLLGAAHTIRGAFDEGSLDAPGARDAARGVLGEAGFDAAYERGRALDGDEGIAAAQGALAGPPAAG